MNGPSKNEQIYTRSIGAKVTPEMLNAVRRAAVAAELKPGEWLRHVIANALKEESLERLILAEVLSLRMLYLSVEGKTGTVPEAELRALALDANERKWVQVEGRIAKAKQLDKPTGGQGSAG